MHQHALASRLLVNDRGARTIRDCHKTMREAGDLLFVGRTARTGRLHGARSRTSGQGGA